MTIYDFASGVTMHGFNHVFVKEMDVRTPVHGSSDHSATRVVWTSPYIHGQGPINFEDAYLDFGISRIVRTFCTSGKRVFSCNFLCTFSCTISNKIQCAPRVMFWLSSPHVTNIEEVSAQLLKFPSITICNVNPVLFSKVKIHRPFNWQILENLSNCRFENFEG